MAPIYSSHPFMTLDYGAHSTQDVSYSTPHPPPVDSHRRLTINNSLSLRSINEHTDNRQSRSTSFHNIIGYTTQGLIYPVKGQKYQFAQTYRTFLSSTQPDQQCLKHHCKCPITTIEIKCENADAFHRQKLKVTELKELLHKHDLPQTGKKDDLVKRLLENNIAPEAGEEELVSCFLLVLKYIGADVARWIPITIPMELRPRLPRPPPRLVHRLQQ